MFGKRMWTVVVAAMVVAWAMPAFAQGRGFDPAAMLERYKTQLNATDEEWTTLKPKVEKVMNARNATNVRVRPNTEATTDVGKAAVALRTALADENAKPEDLKAKLADLRTAREKANADLAKAQAELKTGMSVKQECAAVLAGLID